MHTSFRLAPTLRGVFAGGGAVLLAALLPAPVTAKVTAAPEPSEPAPAVTAADDRLTVSNVRGRVFRIKEGGAYVSLQPGAAIDTNRPIKVGPRSRADLVLRSGGTLELGPDAQVVLFPPRREGREEADVTALRLDKGYLRIKLTDQPPNSRFEVSFGPWSAQLKPGDYVFDTADDQSSVCLVSGEIRVSGSGASESSAPLEPQHCLRTTGSAQTVIPLGADDWDAIDRRRALLPLLADAGRRERDEALQKLEAQFTANPDASVAAPVATSTAANEDTAVAKMPRARPVRLTAAQPVSTARLESQIRSLDRRIERQEAQLAEALVASVKVPIAPVPAEEVLAKPVEAAAPAPAPAPTPAVTDTAEFRPATLASAEPQATATKLALPANTGAVLTPVSLAPPRPAPVDAAEPILDSTSSEWIVNVATHPTLESAEAQAEQLRAQKLATSIRRETVRGRSSYRVVIEGLATEQAANTLVQTLASDLGLRQAWVFRKR